MARRGFGQADTDEMELWVIAELLGVNKAHADETTGVVTAETHAAQSAELIRRRLAASRTGEKVVAPAGGFEPMTVTDDMADALRRRREHRTNHQGRRVPGCTFCDEEAVT